MDYICHYHSPLGEITLASDGKALTGLYFVDQKYYGDVLSEEYKEETVPVFDEAIRWLDQYFQGKIPETVPELKIQGTAFRMTIWKILQTIPYGHTMTYGRIAELVAKERGIEKMSAQAVGNAIGHNPISLIIPCHRVIGSDGSLVGYAGGLDRKQKLLELEKAVLSGYHNRCDLT